jgi:hypothetical protein
LRGNMRSGQGRGLGGSRAGPSMKHRDRHARNPRSISARDDDRPASALVPPLAYWRTPAIGREDESILWGLLCLQRSNGLDARRQFGLLRGHRRSHLCESRSSETSSTYFGWLRIASIWTATVVICPVSPAALRGSTTRTTPLTVGVSRLILCPASSWVKTQASALERGHERP